MRITCCYLAKMICLALFVGFANTWLGGIARAQLVVGDSNVGYIDSAVVATQFRIRFDAAYDSIFPDRVEWCRMVP